MDVKTLLIVKCLLVAGLQPDWSLAQCDCPQTADVWLVNARDAHCTQNIASSELGVERWCGGRWLKSEIDEIASDSPRQTVIYIHGYQTDLCHARKSGLQVFKNLFGKCEFETEIRFIVWAWKSERESCRPINDFMQKSERAQQLGQVFANSLNKLTGEHQAVIIGYSLGAQIAVSALSHSNRLPVAPVKLATIAAANGCDFSRCCQPHPACGNIDEFLMILNQDDRAIRIAESICRCQNKRFHQTFEDWVASRADFFGQLELVDISGVATKKHSILRYTSMPIVQASIQELIASASHECCVAENPIVTKHSQSTIAANDLRVALSFIYH